MKKNITDNSYKKTMLMAGGLGNQMFIYAFAKEIEHNSNIKMYFDFWESKRLHNGYELKKIFDIDLPVASRYQIKPYRGSFYFYLFGEWWSLKRILRRFSGKKSEDFIVEPVSREFHRDFYKKCFSQNTKYIRGVFQDERYFEGIKKEIIKDFKFPIFIKKKNKYIAKKIENSNSISIHVRRGDYLMKKYCSLTNLSETDYYKKSIKYVNEHTKNPTFFCFSDDIEWCKKKFSNLKKIYYINWNKKNQSFRDMQLMSLCKHNIIANSTFSWWGQYLNNNPEKIVISPKKWYNNNKIFSIGNLSRGYITF